MSDRRFTTAKTVRRMDLARGPTFPLTPPPYNTVRGKMQKRSAAAELARKQNHVFVHGTEVRDGEEGSSLTGGGVEERGGGRRIQARARAHRDSITIDRPASLSTNIGPVRDKAARFVRFLEPRAISLGYV